MGFRPTLKDVAAKSGYALRTVKKVMSGDPSVRDKTRDAVLQAAAALSYTPNRAASALGKRKQINVALVYSKPSEVYFSDLERGFRRCAEELFDYGLNLHDYTTAEANWQAQTAILDELLHSDIDGIILQPISATKLDRNINALVQSGKPVVTVGSDAPSSRRLCFVGCDAVQSGRIAGQLLAAYTGGQGKLLIVSDCSDQEQARKRAEGLENRLAECHPQMAIYHPDAVEQALGHEELIQKLVLEQKISGLFCTSGNNTISAGKALRSLGASQIPLIGFDLSPDSSSLLREGWIQVLLDQKPDIHAHQAVKILFTYLTDGAVPEAIQRLPVYLFTSECLPASD